MREIAMTSLEVRPARTADLPLIGQIWNRMIRETAATFTSIEKTPEALVDWLEAGRAAGHPRLAALVAGRLVGFASAGPFRAGPGYARTLEHSIILAEDAAARGFGRALMARLETEAKAVDTHSLIAGISGENLRAVAFHRRLGFREVGRLPEVGFKFGRWMDLVLMQKML
jgi:phosphinothricin acetyltransferase